jgi:hypothetical protein
MTAAWKYDRELAGAVSSAVYADFMKSPTLRRAVLDGQLSKDGFRNLMISDVERFVSKKPGPELFPSLRRVVKTQMNVEEAKMRGGMNQWAELAQAIAGAATGIYTAKLTTDTAKKLQSLEVQKQTLALQSAQINANNLQLQLAVSQGVPAAAGGAAGSIVSAMPTEAKVAVGAGALALVAGAVYLATR